jgi:hypothetical protein
MVAEPLVTPLMNLLPLRSTKQHPDPQDAKIKAPADGPVVIEDFDDGWPRYEELLFVYH